MANLQVSELNVPGVIKKLKSSEWLSPLFQRDFVWGNAAVVSLVNSIIDARPIGMITLWEQEGQSALPLEPISIPDHDSSGKSKPRYFGSPKPEDRPGRYYAILDGRQRSTALALAFGGLRANSGLFRNSGRYYLDVAARESTERVKFFSEKDVVKRKLNQLNVAVSQGLFPLEVSDPDQVFDQWMNYLQYLRDPGFYPDGQLPEPTELERRNRTLKSAFDGIIKTKIALYVVPQTYDLAEICDIFETLNTTGTKVSTVDLIHSNIYSDTASDRSGPVLIREKIDELGDLEGAVGWASSRERPELIAQFAASAYVALDTKPPTRPINTGKEHRITSVKSQDLLAISARHWRSFFEESSKVAGFLGACQLAVAGGHFPMSACPYPASVAIYFALRWFHEFDRSEEVDWTTDHLDQLFRAFFWRNTFRTRYDQGFLTQIGTDIREMKSFLSGVKESPNSDLWRGKANAWLNDYMGLPLEREVIFDIVSDGSESGALKKAPLLLISARASVDLFDSSVSIKHGSGNMQLHHIYPKDWCANNVAGTAKNYLDPEIADRDYINSAANLMPMSRNSNLAWRKKAPAQFIDEQQIGYDAQAHLWNSYFIDRTAFELLALPAADPGAFWRQRANLITEEIYLKMAV